MAPPHIPGTILTVIPHMKPFTISLALTAALGLTISCLSAITCPGAEAAEPATTAAATTPIATPAGNSDFSAEGDDKEHASERKEIEGILNNIESQWNAHDIKAVMANYADDYYNNDGLDKKAVQKLTEDFWKTYPDAHSVSRTKEIRVDGNFATVESRDTATGTTKMKDMNSLGELQSVSEGQQYLKRLGNVWKIIGDRIDYEKVKVAFGLAKHLNASFTAPEQVKAGKLYAAKLEVNLPPGLHAVGSITNQPLVFPQKSPQEKTRRLGSSSDEPDQTPVLERVMSANKDNHNELLSATVILVNPNNSVMGVSLMTRRLNVVPDQPEIKDDTTTAANPSDDADKVADSSTKAGEEPAKGEVEKAKPEASKDEKPKAETEKEKLEEGYKNSPPSK